MKAFDTTFSLSWIIAQRPIYLYQSPGWIAYTSTFLLTEKMTLFSTFKSNYCQTSLQTHLRIFLLFTPRVASILRL